jgi:hypothetical protein
VKGRDNIYDTIRDLFGDLNNNLQVLEDQIDIDVQTEYFEYSKTHNLNFNPEDVIKNKEVIFQNDMSVEDKKCMLVKLASINSVEAFRTIERYLKHPNHNLRDWAKLAFQESKLLLESKLLDENQVLISTGLGGKGLKLRYFTVFISDTGEILTKIQKKIIRSELSYLFNKHNAEAEKISFREDICTILSVIPVDVPVRNIFDTLIKECNQFGDFLNKYYLITNVKILTINEIKEFINENFEHLGRIN